MNHPIQKLGPSKKNQIPLALEKMLALINGSVIFYFMTNHLET